MKIIRFYRVDDLYGCFSNFSPHSVIIDGVEWRTTEHYFQAMKFLDPKLQARAREIVSPMKVALFGRDRSLPLRPDWDDVKDDIMRKAVLHKVVQNREVFEVLLSTGNAEIIEHTKNDFYWADGGDGTGKNMLGVILMEVRDMMNKALRQIEIVEGDITKSKLDSIVNAANKSLTGGGGVDGAIHRVSGSELKDYCAKYKGCKSGEARVSSGFALDAKYIIHAVGPVWYGGDKDEEKKLHDAYRNSMLMAKELRVSSIAFPNISTGAYKFPFKKATEIQKHTLVTSLFENDEIRKIEIVCFTEKDFKTVTQLYRN